MSVEKYTKEKNAKNSLLNMIVARLLNHDISETKCEMSMFADIHTYQSKKVVDIYITNY